METDPTVIDTLLSAFEPLLGPDTPLRMEVNLHVPERNEDSVLFIALRIGVERMYVVRNLALFLRAKERGERLLFGKGFAYDPAAMRFEKIDEKILSVLAEIEVAQRPCEAQGYRTPQEGKFMPLGERAAERILRLLMARPFRLVSGKEIIPMGPVARRLVPVACELKEEGRGLAMTIRMPGDIRVITSDYAFVHTQGEIVQLPKQQRHTMAALLRYAGDGEAVLHFAPKDVRQVIAEIMPQLEFSCDVSLSGKLAARIRREPLKARAYIDREGDRVIARIAFQYGERVIDPFAREEPDEAAAVLLVRDAAAEHQVLDTLAQSGFHVGKGRVYLAGSARVLRFIQEGVGALQRVAEVYASEAFHHMRPRRPQLSGRLGMSGGALQLTLFDDDTPLEDIAGLMQALRERKKYFRLRDGAFLDLKDLEGWDELAALLGDVAEEDTKEERSRDDGAVPVMVLRAYRAAYLVSMLAGNALPVQVEQGVMDIAAVLTQRGDVCPEPLQGVLRSYQERGFQWLQALYRLNMGGVLADDMGLGKTLQVIAAMMWAKEKEGAAPSLVVAPTSLLYNWQAELQRFAPGLRVTVVEGSQAARFRRWGELKRDADMDVIITSYPLLRRDINVIGDTPFRFLVLDEAQHIKNPQSLSAVSASRLSGRTRLALTGTPMENNPGELWSIFHFVLPGYLMSLAQFMRRHGDGSGSDALARRIRPFLLRRLKADVLPELPEKIETRVLADMPREQRNVYAASATQLRERVENVLASKGLGRGRMEVLSAITQLRQICCHPALVLEGYAGSSGKLDALMEILMGALASGRRVLLFSQFTSMLAILRRALDSEKVRCLYLDGKTPVAQRMELVNRFNTGEGQVFLISLKAGGAGLNLTGADTVIHYDPWWNPAAEDQATDRAHRIGQKKVVQVIRLITRGTIEEQVVRLSERKRALFDAVVTAGEQMPSDMTAEEIMSLFA